jgi:RNA polymerase sigma-70 factor, ECF subfamily
LSEVATCCSELRHSNPRPTSILGTVSRRERLPWSHASPANDCEDSQFDSIMKQCNQRVYWLARRITRNHHDAEDARQETFLKAYRHLDQFEGRSPFTTWISRIAINEGLMNLRKRNDSRCAPLDEIAETAIERETLLQFHRPIEDPEVGFRRRQLRSALNAAIASLRPLYRDVFVLRAVDENSTSDTAKALGLTISTVKTRLRRARTELRAHLATCGEMAEIVGAIANSGKEEETLPA